MRHGAQACGGNSPRRPEKHPCGGKGRKFGFVGFLRLPSGPTRFALFCGIAGCASVRCSCEWRFLRGKRGTGSSGQRGELPNNSVFAYLGNVPEKHRKIPGCNSGVSYNEDPLVPPQGAAEGCVSREQSLFRALILGNLDFSAFIHHSKWAALVTSQ